MAFIYEPQKIPLSNTGGVGSVPVSTANAALLVPGLRATLTGVDLDPISVIITGVDATAGLLNLKADPDASPASPYQGPFSATAPTYGLLDFTSFTVAKSATLWVPRQTVVKPTQAFRP